MPATCKEHKVSSFSCFLINRLGGYTDPQGRHPGLSVLPITDVPSSLQQSSSGLLMILLPRRQSSRGEKKTESHGVLSPSQTPHIHLLESRVVSYIQGDLPSPFSKTRKKNTNLSRVYTHEIWVSARNPF